ncbi:MAG: FMN-binding protein [Pseudomonadales bacterium]|nr:FMN-binding protein [Pseudomonadales bacterium]
MCFRFVLRIWLLALANIASAANPGSEAIVASKNIHSNNSTQTFITEMFSGSPPKLRALWLNAEIRKQLTNILGHAPQTLRVKYRQKGNQSLWVFDEIGKTKPITFGVFIRSGKIEDIRVLKFRESRGWEIKYSFFTDQFRHTSLTDNHQLSQTIDGITGATLSVNAMKRVARAALFLDQKLVLDQKLYPRLQQTIKLTQGLSGSTTHETTNQTPR